MHYADSVKKIPAMAVATAVANLLEKLAGQDSELRISMEINSRTLPDRLSDNVMAQTTGNLYPDKVIAFGGHFDSWDQGEGAHDDGAGCMHAFEALRILKAIGYKPRHTLRCVWWMNEENGLRGATDYATKAANVGENHVAALESDRGGFTPRGFGVDSAFIPKLNNYRKLLEQYGIGSIEKGGGGADIGPLRKANPKAVLVGFIPDSQRYFDVHHAETDVFENVNKRELELGAAAVAVMIAILDMELN
jgi:Zn-dependent M28 family amino/carboxypeptidase